MNNRNDPNYEAFLKLDLRPYGGEWVAIYERKVVCHGKKFDAVFRDAKKKFPGKNPFFAMVPGKEKWIF